MKKLSKILLSLILSLTMVFSLSGCFLVDFIPDIGDMLDGITGFEKPDNAGGNGGNGSGNGEQGGGNGGQEGSGNGGQEGGGSQEGGGNVLSQTQISDMQSAITQTKNYTGSYTINETSSLNMEMSANGQTQTMPMKGLSAMVSFNGDSKGLYWYLPSQTVTDTNGNDVLSPETFFYTLPVGAGYSQYSMLGNNKYKKDFADYNDLQTNGLSSQNMAGENIGIYYRDLNESLENIFNVSLTEILNVQNSNAYYDFWLNLYKPQADGIVNAVNAFAGVMIPSPIGEVTYTNGGSELIQDGSDYVYKFKINATPNNPEVLEVYPGYDFSFNVSIKVTDLKLAEIAVNISITLPVSTANGEGVLRIYLSAIDAFTYEFDSSKIPSDLDSFPLV